MTFNLTDDEILVGRLGPRHKVLVEAVVLTIVYVILFVTGVIGNVSTCIVIMRNSYMHTATNYYLFSLAISDVLTLLTGKFLLLDTLHVCGNRFVKNNKKLMLCNTCITDVWYI